MGGIPAPVRRDGLLLRFDVDSKDAADAAAMVAMETGIGHGLINLGGDIHIVGHLLAQRGERREQSG